MWCVPSALASFFLVLSVSTLRAQSADAEKSDPKAGVRLDPHGDPLPEWAKARLGTIRWHVTGRITALSPDGKVIAVGGSQVIELIDARTGLEIRRFRGGAIGAQALAFSPDGKRLIISDHNKLAIADASTGAKTGEIPAPGRLGYGSTFSFSADGRFVTSGIDQYGRNTGVFVWELEKAAQIGPFPMPGAQRVGAALAPNGKVLATWSVGAGRSIQLWDVAAVKEAGEIGDVAGVTAVAFSPDGKTLAVTGPATVALIELGSGKERLRFATRRGPTSPVFSADGKRLAITTAEGAVQLFDIEGSKRLGM